MPRRSEPLRKLGFLTIGLFDEHDPGAGHRTTLDIIALGEELGVRQRVGAPSAPAVRHLLADRGPGRRDPADQQDQPGHRGHPAGMGEPAAARGGPGDGRRAVRRSAQPRGERRAADALRRRQARALPGRRGRRGLRLRPAGAVARLPPRRQGHGLQRHRGHRGLLRPRAAALPRPERADVVRRREPAVGEVGR